MVVRFLRPYYSDGAGFFNPGESADLSEAAGSRLCAIGAAESVAPILPSSQERPPIMTTAYHRPPADKMLRRAPRRKGGRHAQ